MVKKTQNLEQKTNSSFKKLKNILSGGLIVASIAGLSACETTPTPMVFTRTIDRSTPRDVFNYDEAIKLHLRNYSGRTATYYIQDISTGSSIQRQTFYIPRDWSGVEWTIGNLPRGSYYTWVEVEGKAVGTWRFSVR